MSSANKQVTVATSDATNTLSPREMRVVLLITEGKSYRQIADDLSVRYSTVKTFLKRIRRKLNVKSKVQILVWAVANKLIGG